VPADPTDADREAAERIVDWFSLDTAKASDRDAVAGIIADARADERERARAPFLDLADELDRDASLALTECRAAWQRNDANRIRRIAQEPTP
jgi:hypothetical protein